jgi:hypothetical protein
MLSVLPGFHVYFPFLTFSKLHLHLHVLLWIPPSGTQRLWKSSDHRLHHCRYQCELLTVTLQWDPVEDGVGDPRFSGLSVVLGATAGSLVGAPASASPGLAFRPAP